MQTFLPYPNFTETAKVLDDRRLGKQRVENLQIMSALIVGRGWMNHPATKMWKGYEDCLFAYQEAICFQWLRRGFRDTCYVKTADLLFEHRGRRDYAEPLWLGDEDFHISHQSNLIRKNPEHYGPLFPGVPDYLPYVWPI